MTRISRIFINFAADMHISNRLINIILAVIAVGLFVLCVANITSAR